MFKYVAFLMSISHHCDYKSVIQKMIQELISAFLIFCDLKEVAEKQELDHRENYRINNESLVILLIKQ